MSAAISLKETAELLLANDDFAIICHASPDGDTLGGAYALCGALQKLQKRAKVLVPEEPSKRFDYLHSGIEPQEFNEEFIITIDVADSALLGKFEEKHKTPDLCIDHHVSNTGYAKRLLLDSEAAAACEVVFELIKELGDNIITADIASCLYTGISTDTGCFRFSNTTAKTHRFAAELIEYGFDCSGLNYLLFEIRTKDRIKLEKQALESVEFYLNGRCAVIIFTKEMLESADDEDINAISALPRQIEGVEAGVTFKEKEAGVWKISIRTKNYMNAQVICAKFGGGGHQRAAGCRITGDVRDCKEKILTEIERHLKKQKGE
ncbi:MAG: bifunctional oligoribonuclease/PAP phosphatase NrnA [Oscillospiraceae bacterium]|jgi:phosphoesterase RecJ-like protein|nr:bifunctional oligoribonuclease/PAP phosphatase NrnA [Oscillospiraceae bacterium]